MASVLPDFPPFDIDTDPTSVGITWKKWIQRFDNLLVALDVSKQLNKLKSTGGDCCTQPLKFKQKWQSYL